MRFQESAERFALDTANHSLTILHDDGLYRHLRFKARGTGMYWFDLVTWPGHLSIVGDIDPGIVFARIEDMFEFFRAKSGWNGDTINPQYWAEKIVTGRDLARQYSEDLFRRLVVESFVDAVRYGDAPRGLGKAIREGIFDEDLSHEETARELLDGFEYQGFRFSDTWEWDFRDWHWSYLWCCHAIQWGIGQYDQARAAVPVGSAA